MGFSIKAKNPVWKSGGLLGLYRIKYRARLFFNLLMIKIISFFD
jgi:hypothetical protein